MFLDRLPTHGHYKSALAMDEQWAARLVELHGDVDEGADAAPTPLGYSPEIAYLALIADRLMAVRTAVQAGYAQGGEPTFEPLPRPVTAIDRERERRVIRELLDIDRELRGL